MSEVPVKTPPTEKRPITCPQCGAPVTLPGYANLAACPYCGSHLRRTQPLIPVPPDLAGGGRLGRPGLPAPDRDPADRDSATGSPARAGEQILRSLSCPQCAGPLSVRAGRRILLCSRCGVRILTHGHGGLSHWLFPQTVDRIRALSAAARWLTTHPGIAPSAREIPVRSARLVHVPIWEHTVLVAGWEFGTKLRTKTFLATNEDGNDRLELEVKKERFEDPHVKERRYFQAACDLPSLGANRPRFSGRELLLPLLAGEVDPSSQVLEPSGEPSEVAERGRCVALLPMSGAADPRTWMLILRESMTLLYYPLWLVDYKAAGQPHRIVIDANDGTVNSATAPAANQRLQPLLILKVAGLLIVAVLAAWVSSIWAAGRVPTIFLAVIVLVAAVLLVLRSPAGGKVEYHEPFSS